MDNSDVGNMVLVLEEKTPPLQWPLDRIQKIYPGKDGLTRVVEVLARGKVYKRPMVR